MPITILCPLSKQAIKEPVIHNGYIYDKSSLKALATLEMAPADLTVENLQKDFFTQSLLDHQDSIDFDDEDVMSEICKDPITLEFPEEGVLCIKDGHIYEKKNIANLYNTSAQRTNGFVSLVDETKRLNIATDFFAHPLYQHLMRELKKTKEKGMNTISLNAIFENFEQPVAELTVFPRESFVTPRQPGKPAVIIIFVILAAAILLCTVIFGALFAGPYLLVGIVSTITYLNVNKDLYLGFKFFQKKTYGWVILMAAVLPMDALLFPSVIFNLPIVSIPIAVASAILSVKLLLESSFFDKDANFNLNKSNTTRVLSGIASLMICLILTAALSFGIFITLSSFSLGIPALVMCLSAIVPVIFSSLYRNIYNFRCTNFFNQALSLKINADWGTNIYRAIFIISICLLSYFAFPIIGPLSTCVAGIATLLVGMNLDGFYKNQLEFKHRKEAMNSSAPLNATPLIKLELKGDYLSALQRKIFELRTPAPQPSASAGATNDTETVTEISKNRERPHPIGASVITDLFAQAHVRSKGREETSAPLLAGTHAEKEDNSLTQATAQGYYGI